MSRPCAGQATLDRVVADRQRAERERPHFRGETPEGEHTAIYFDGRFQIRVRFDDPDLRALACIRHGLTPESN